MRYLGLDLGTKTLGVAITDKSNTLAVPYKTIRFDFEDYNAPLNELRNIIKEYNISEIALGNPLNMNGSCGFASNRSLQFKEILVKELGLNVSLVDERLTSTEAHNILSSNGKKEINHKKSVDAVAASIILETFLRKKESHHE